MIPLTYSIASGLGFGMIAFAGLRLIRGHFRKEDWPLYVLALLFLLPVYLYGEELRGPGKRGYPHPHLCKEPLCFVQLTVVKGCIREILKILLTEMLFSIT